MSNDERNPNAQMTQWYRISFSRSAFVISPDFLLVNLRGDR
jgi:hypothetical protein